VPSVSHTVPRRRWRAHRRRGEAWGGKQAGRECDWPYPRSIGGEGSAGEVTGERQRRGSGSAAAGARIPTRRGAGLNKVRHGYLPCVLGKVLGGSQGLENRRRGELSNGDPAATAEARAPASRQFG
jgi:hypothetical protein